MEKKLVLVFKDTGENKKQLTIKNIKNEEITYEEVTELADTLIDNDVLICKDNNSLNELVTAYVEEVTKVVIA